MRGCYRDCVTDGAGRLVDDSGWHSNVIAYTAWAVVAALLRNDAAMRGVLFCAVGSGAPEWDTHAPVAATGTARLRTERDRRPLDRNAFAYLDGRGAPATRPTDRLEITARFAGTDESLVLREFGLFGGDATATTNSGYLINYVIHPRLELRAGRTLTRRVRLTLRPSLGGAGGDLLTVPAHWLGDEAPTVVDGVGDAFAAALTAAGVKTIAGLAALDPRPTKGIPFAKVIELRSKARLALRTAAAMSPLPALGGRTAWDIITTPTEDLQTGDIAPLFIDALREQVAALQLVLDARYLKRLTLAELSQKTRS